MAFLYVNGYICRPFDMIYRGLGLMVTVYSQCKVFFLPGATIIIVVMEQEVIMIKNLIVFPFNYCILFIYILLFVIIYKVPHVPFYLTLLHV